MATNNEFVVTPEFEILSRRVFGYPVEKVFAAWSDPEKLRQWWGPAGFTNTFHAFDFRPGGIWRFTMHGPRSGHYENEVVFKRTDAPRLIVWDRVSKPLFRIVATFEAVDEGRTLLSFRMQFSSAAECDKIRPFAPEKNEENFDRLNAVLRQG